MKLLSKTEIAIELNALPCWSVKDNTLFRQLNFDSFGEAIQFTQQLGQLAEQHNHHPDIYIHYNKINLHLTTKDLQGISQKDFFLAKEIDTLRKKTG